MILLGIDPGAVHVGWSIWRENYGVQSFECTPEQTALDVLLDGLKEYDRVYIEDFQPNGGYGSMKTGVATAEMLGLIYWKGWADKVPVIKVPRAQRAGALRRLKAADWPFNTESNHAKDACAVVLAGLQVTIREARVKYNV